MVILQNSLKRLLRDKYTFIMMIVMPIIIISFVMFSVGSNTAVKVGVIDKDGTKLTEFIKKEMGKNCEVVSIKEDDIKRKLFRNRIEYAVVIDKGFTEQIISGEDARLKSYSIKEANSSMPPRFFLEGLMTSIKNIAETSNNNEDSFYKGIEYYSEGSYQANYEFIENTNAKRLYTTMAIGNFIMFMLYLSVNSTSLVLQDKQFKTYGRILTAPISLRSYTMQNSIGSYGILAAQITIILSIMKFIFKADFGSSIFNVYILLLIFAVTSIALGTMIASFSKDSRQANGLSSLIIVPMCMIGGCFWDKSMMPEILQKVSQFVPTTWVLDATQKLLYGKRLMDIYVEIMVILLFALVFFLIGSNRKRMKNMG